VGVGAEESGTPDGSLIAFLSRDDIGMHLDVVHPDGSSHRRVADGDFLEFEWSSPLWRPTRAH
jgi:hypothetical protein